MSVIRRIADQRINTNAIFREIRWLLADMRIFGKLYECNGHRETVGFEVYIRVYMDIVYQNTEVIMGLRKHPEEMKDDILREKKRKKHITIIVLLCLTVLFAGAAYEIYRIFGPNRSRVNLREYFGNQGDNEWAILLNKSGTGQMATETDGELYLSLEYVRENLDGRYYRDESLQALLYVLPDRIVRIYEGETFYYEGEEQIEFGKSILLTQGEEIYLSLDFFERYSDYTVSRIEENHVVWLWNLFDQGIPYVSYGKDRGVLRTRATERSPILTDLTAQTVLLVISEEENWKCVMTDTGLIGYVKTKELADDATITDIIVERKKELPEYTSVSMAEKVCLVWHQMDMYNYEAQAGKLAELLSGTKSINVVSPTWYSLSSVNGDFTSLSSKEYVQQAHDMGMQVWALIDNFNPEVNNLAFLSSYEARQHLIEGLMQEAREYGLDGINIDFEAQASGLGGLNKECGPHFLEFLRELSAECRKAGLVLSVDNYVPASYNQYYDRTEQGKIVDYVIVMGYDEHYAGSEETGSVASYGFVKAGIENTISEVPASKVINAIPFYTRVWSVIQEEERQVIISSEAMGMNAVRNLIAEKQVEPVWLESVKQLYGEYEAEGFTCQIWVENADSIRWKLELIRENGLAGVACWKLGLESEDIWNVMEEELAE